MTTITPYAITALSLTAETFRQAPSSLIAGTGVVGTSDLAVSQNGTPNMSVNMAPGQAWVPGTLASTSGFPANLNAQTAYGLPSSFNEQASYFGWSGTTVNLPVAAADPTNPRIDLVVVSVQDAQYSGSSNQMVPQVITGTAAPSPSAPSAPAATLVIAQISVPAAATSITTGDITDKRPYLALQSPARGNPAAHATFAGITLSGAAQQLAFTGTPLLYGGVTVSSNGFVAPAAGLYRVKSNIQLNYASGSNFWVEGFIYQNGVTVADFLQVEGTFVNGFPGFEFSKLVSAAAGDVFKFYAESSSAPNVNSDDKGSYAEIELVSQA